MSQSRMSQSNSKKNRVLEVRPGEGGDDAYAFAQDLVLALLSYARRNQCEAELLERTGSTNSRTFKAEVRGSEEFLQELERLAGTHRIQRVPANDRRGRRQTSTATVAVLAGGDSEEVVLQESDLQVDTYRGSGPGGQHRNKTSSAVRMKHVPTGLVVTMEHGRSQYQNITWAREELSRRLQARAEEKTRSTLGEERNEQIASGERAAKSYTHTAWRDEVVCHESGERWRLQRFMQGRIE